MGRRRAATGPKQAKYQLIPRDSIDGRKMYELLDELVSAHHDQVINARFALAWNRTWKPDSDGHVKLGMCRKASDLDRELAPYDFVVILREDFWTSPAVDDKQRRALLDHELCHASVKYDKDGEPARDAKDRVIYRIRKHDIEEFSEIVARHGTWKRDLESFAAALKIGQRQRELDIEVEVRAPKKPEAPAHH